VCETFNDYAGIETALIKKCSQLLTGVVHRGAKCIQMETLLRNCNMEKGIDESENSRFQCQSVKQHFLAGFILLLATVACFHQCFLHPGDLLVGIQGGGQNDATRVFIAYRSFQQVALSQYSQWPFWNPFGLSGMPWLGNPQSGLFYPADWLFLCFDAANVITWVTIGHYFWAGLGTYFLGLRYRFHWWAAVLGGVAFLGAPHFIAKSCEGHFNIICLIAWFPWALLCYEYIRIGSKVACAGLVVLLSLCFFCGHVQELFYLVIILTSFVLIDCFRGKKSGMTLSAGQLLRRWTLLGGLTAGLVAIDLLPIFFYTFLATRSGGVTAAEASKNSLEPLSLLQLLDPLALGGPENYLPAGKLYWETLSYFGVGTALLAVLGVMFGLRRYPVSRIFILLIASFLFSFGDSLPVFPLMHRFVPGISFFRAPSRALIFSSLAISILAAAGVNSLITVFQSTDVKKKKQLFRSMVGLGVLCCVGLGGMYVFQKFSLSPQQSTESLTLASAFQSMAVGRAFAWAVALFVALFAIMKSRRFIPYYAAACVCLIGFELSQHAQGILTRVPYENIRTENSLVSELKTSEDFGRVLVSQHHLSDREAWAASIAKVQGTETVPLSRFGLYLGTLVLPHEPSFELMGFNVLELANYNPALLDLLGVSHVVLAPNQNVNEVDWQLVSQGTIKQEFSSVTAKQRTLPYRLFKKRDPFPRAYVLGATKQLNPQNDVVEQLLSFDPRKTVLIERDELPKGKRQSFQPATIREYTPNRITIEAELTAPGYLVLSDIFYPGWSATVDQRPSVVVPANFAFRAVPLGPGRHVVRFEYQPPGLVPGGILSGVSLCFLVLWMFTGSAKKSVKSQLQSVGSEPKRTAEDALEKGDSSLAATLE